MFNNDEVRLAEVAGACQVPGCLNSRVSLAEAVVVWLRSLKDQHILPWVHLLQVNVGKAKSENFGGFDLSEYNLKLNLRGYEGDSDKVGQFRGYRQALADKLVVLRRLSDSSEAKVIRQSDSSRYFAVGRYRMKAKIIKRMGGFYSCSGLMLSCTYDPKLLSRDEAWADVGARGRRLMDNVNGWRRREGMAKVRGIKVLEEQSQTGYPHIHIAFPKLRWLARVEDISRWWGQAVNSCELTYRDSFSPAGYVCKYVSKMEGWSDEGLAEIWFNRTRAYSMSSDYYLQPVEKRVPEWSFYGTKRLSSLSMAELMVTFDSVVGDQELLISGFT